MPGSPITPAVGGVAYRRAVALYDRLAAPLWEATVGRRALARVRAELAAQAAPGAAVLDLGAGTGRSTRLVLEHADPAHVVCVDAAAAMLAELERRLDDPRVETVQADAAALPFAEDTFDVVVSLWLLETLPDPLAAIQGRCASWRRPERSSPPSAPRPAAAAAACCHSSSRRSCNRGSPGASCPKPSDPCTAAP